MTFFEPGRGLNSIRWRFAVAGAVLTLIGVLLRDAVLDALGRAPVWASASLVVLGTLVAAAIFWMAQRLTGMIEALRRSTDAIAAGDFNAPVDVDCACEIGGLAHSFRAMTSRLNANVVRINALAYVDAITGLPNRSVIDHMLNHALAPERAARFRAAIIFIDLDGFKRVNDTLGHQAGDELLRQASRRILERGLQRSAANIDTCMDAFGAPCERPPRDVVFARFAGDEFVAILPGVTDRAALAEVGERIVSSLAQPFRLNGQEVRIGASVGIAVAPDDTTNAAELVAFADLAMYGSKQAGKARYSFFDRQARTAMLAVARLESELRQALERDELVLHFQPKLGMRPLQLHGVEALARWPAGSIPNAACCCPPSSSTLPNVPA